MDLQLTGKHVLITGGSKGIGLACAEGFLKEGAKVSIIARGLEALNEARTNLLLAGASDRNVCIASADLRDAQATEAAIVEVEAALGPVDILVNSAGAARRMPPRELTPQHWRDAMDAKFFTYVNATSFVIKGMAERGSGAILNIVGMGGKIASPTHLAGGAANAALMLMSAGLANAYGSAGVRVNAVNPTVTLTDRMEEGIVADAQLKGISKAQALEQTTARMPLGRIATSVEVADAVLFLCSPRASYISGSILSIDGAITPLVV